jgi:DNA-binding HxlR family transcriptional regulator
MTVQLEGTLAHRSVSPGDRCPIDRAMQAIGTRSAILLMREAFYGTGRFDDFVTMSGLTEAVTAQRLRELVDAGLLAKQPYREPGQRTRYAYVLTDSGRDLMPAVFALGQWAASHVPHRGTPRLSHAGCGGRVDVEFRCREGHAVIPDELVVTG